MADELRKRLLKAGRHLTATRFGWAVNQATGLRGIDWGGCSKGVVIDAVRQMLAGERVHNHPHNEGFTIEHVEQVLRDAPAHDPSKHRTGNMRRFW